MREIALITGASSGFGYEFVKLFAQDQYDMILVARNIDRLIEIKNEFKNVNITVIQKDLTKPNAVKELFSEIKNKNLSVDILVNNAGFGLFGQFDKLSAEAQSNMITLNISVLTELSHHAIQEMKLKNRGKIINIASLGSFQPAPMMAVYCATKAYVLSFSEALAKELKGSGITVTTLCPGASKTNFGKVASVENTRMFKNPMSASSVVKIGYRAMHKGSRVVIPGILNKAMAYTSKFLPRKLVVHMIGSFTKEI
ncbi:SDR family NAD(P)-dependent oxidoreductase [Clostridium manihotivorum]|uniref:Short-chain dehydrogenase n=1 Tax=Clostridium manihotivorum TaxID=2320868 RepID=A0A410E1C1_9CLOT|nr:SDR family oxidoreductase [Clostridium manihotivorum]QAA35150.1 short-chain dehydrogenase [Clostridium manihotivorum]